MGLGIPDTIAFDHHSYPTSVKENRGTESLSHLGEPRMGLIVAIGNAQHYSKLTDKKVEEGCWHIPPFDCAPRSQGHTGSLVRTRVRHPPVSSCVSSSHQCPTIHPNFLSLDLLTWPGVAPVLPTRRWATSTVDDRPRPPRRAISPTSGLIDQLRPTSLFPTSKQHVSSAPRRLQPLSLASTGLITCAPSQAGTEARTRTLPSQSGMARPSRLHTW